MALEIILGDSPTDEGGLLLQPSPLNRVDSEFTRLIKAAFNDMVTLVGVPIVFGSTTKQCIAGAIKLETIVEPKTIGDRKSTRLNSSHQIISYAVFCLKKKK